MTDLATVVRWEAPPPPAKGSGRPATVSTSRYGRIADELRARPGAWAVVEEVSARRNSGLATKISMGAMLCFTPAGDFEAVSRQGNGLVRTYARYLGDGGDW